MSERLYRIGPFGGVALPESYELEPGYADFEGPGAEVIELPRRRSLFGFARAFVEAPPAPVAPRPRTFRTVLSFRRLWPGERTATVEVEEPRPERDWRTEIVFRRAEPVAAVVAEPRDEVASIGTILVRAAAADPAWEEPEISTPSNIETVATPVAAEVNEAVAAEPEPEPELEQPAEPEVVVEPTVEVPAPAVVAAEEHVEQAPASKPSRFRAPTEKRFGRGGGSQKGRPLVGLKVGASQLAAAVVVNDGAPELRQLARTPFESGIVVDGEVRDEDALAAALKDFFAEAKLPTRAVRVGLASNRIGVRTLEIAGVEADRFDNAVRFKAHEVLPIAVDESVLDYRVLSERVADNGELVRRVLLVVAPREQVDPFVGAARKAGIKLHGVDLEAFALLRTFVEPRPVGDGHEQAAIVVVSIGHESTTLVVSAAGVCEFTRILGWGGASLDAAIAAACSVSLVEANAIKTQLSLDGDVAAGLDPSLAGRALEAVRTELTLFARELVASLQFYQKQPESLGIGEVVVTGGTTHLAGLPDALHTLVGVPVRVGDPLARVVAGKGVASDPTVLDTIGSLSVAIGLGIDDDAVRAVDLLPADARSAARRRPTKTQILVPAALVVPVVAVGAMLLPAKSSVSSKESELQSLQTELAALPSPQTPGIDQNIKGEQARRAAVVADVLSKRLAWDRVLRDLALVLPQDVWLTTLDANVPVPLSSTVPVAATGASQSTPAAPTTPTGLRLTGRTYSHTAVARLLARLATVPTFGDVQLTRSTVTDAGGRKVIEFEVAANVRGAREAS